MITVSYDMTGFTQGMAGLVKATGESMRTVVAEETGELIKMLAKVSPPRGLEKPRKRIEREIDLRFSIMDDNRTVLPSSDGATGWYFSNPQFLYGIREDLDMRKASGKEVADKFITYRKRKNGSARWSESFKHPRKLQRVSINQNITISKQNAKSALNEIMKRFGKLKSSWLVAVRDGAIKVTGARIPQWVLRHVHTAQGRIVNELNVKDAPAFTIVNFARGVSSDEVNRLVKFAVGVRIKSMKTNALLFTKGIKHLGDYVGKAGKALVLK